MSLFGLLFLGLSLAGVVSLLAAFWFALRQQSGRAGRILLRLPMCAGGYMAVVVSASLVSLRRSLQADASQCFDDWCIGVAEFRRVPEGGGVACRLDLRLSSRAAEVPPATKCSYGSAYNGVAR